MSVQFAPMVESEKRSGDFRMKVNGIPVPVMQVRVTAQPMNCWWPGHQRPFDQTEIASFATFDFSEPVEIEIEYLGRRIDRIETRPREYDIIPETNGNMIRFTLAEPRHFTVEINGFHKALHLFTNPIEQYNVDIHDENTIYFGPGVHKADLIVPKENQTVYIDAGAVVYGAILVYKADNVRILGRGILDASPYVRDAEYEEGKAGSELIDDAKKLGKRKNLGHYVGNITAIGCRNLTIDGIILRDPPCWSMNIRESCEYVTINNLKLIGLWRYNADGIDICTSSHVKISNCFIRSFDDSIVTRGTSNAKEEDKFVDMVTTGCVLWCEWGRAIEIWTSRDESHISDIIYRDCHIIRTAHVALDLQVYCGGPTYMENFLLENISVDSDYPNESPVYQNHDLQVYQTEDINYLPGLFHAEDCYGIDAPINRKGLTCDINFKNIIVKNIRFYGKNKPKSLIKTVPPYVNAENITFEDIFFNGEKAHTAEEMNLYIGEGAKNIIIK